MISLSRSEKSERSKQFVVFLIICFICFIRYAIVDRIPPFVIAHGIHDDAWVVIRANYILSGEWLGPYDQFTLIKGSFAPLLMAFSRISGITYLHLNTFLYMAGCILFIEAIKPILKRTYSRLICMIWLLFNPVSYALFTWQRIYRNGLSQWQLLMIFAGIIGVYLRRDKEHRTIVPWSLLAGFSIWSFINTREDSIWIYPFIIFAVAITIISVFRSKTQHSGMIRRIILLCLPVLIVFIGNGALSIANATVYGMPIRNDRTSGNYAKVMKDLYLLEPDPEDVKKFSTEEYKSEYLNIYTNTVRKAFSVSPTFNSVSEQVERLIAMWDSGEQIVDGEAHMDTVLFAIRDGVAAAGYYHDLGETEKFFGKVHDELQEAFKKGLIRKRGLSLSAGTAPFQMKYFFPTIEEMWMSIQLGVSFAGVSTEVCPAEGSDAEIQLFEKISGDRALLQDDYPVSISGWALAYEDGKKIQIDLCSSNGDVLSTAGFENSQDVYEYFVSIDRPLANAKKSRFSLSLRDYDQNDKLQLQIKDEDGGIIEVCTLDGIVKNNGIFHEKICYCIDHLWVGNSWNSKEREMANEYADRLNTITKLYQDSSITIHILAFIAYIIICIILIKQKKETKESMVKSTWLLETALLLSYILFVLCIAYMTVTTFYCRHYYYLGSMHVMQLMFSGVAIMFCVEKLQIILNRTLRKEKVVQEFKRVEPANQ